MTPRICEVESLSVKYRCPVVHTLQFESSPSTQISKNSVSSRSRTRTVSSVTVSTLSRESTVDGQESILDFRLSTLDSRLSILDSRLSISDSRLSTLDSRLILLQTADRTNRTCTTSPLPDLFAPW